jgi:radical SAM protein with 4Fe4S-binding SPASM domain
MIRKPILECIDSKRYNFPIDVIIETCSHCTVECIYCPQPGLKRPKGAMDFRVFKKIVDEIASESPDSRLWIAILGEPLLRGDDLVEMLRYARAQGIKNIHVNTNATCLTRDLSHKLLVSGIKEIIFSVDAFTKETYDKIKIGGDFHKTLENIEYFLSIRKAEDRKSPAVIMQFVIMDENEHEAEAFKKYWLGKGVVVKIRLRLGWGAFGETKDLDLARVERNFPCPWLVRTFSIHWDGRVAQCDADYEGLYSPGDIKTQTIKEIWNGELAKRRDKNQALDFSHPLCMGCRDWSVGRSQFYYPEKE